MDLNTVTSVSSPADRTELPLFGPGDALLAGGTWLFSAPQIHLDRLIDLAGLGLSDRSIDADGLHLGATCTLADLDALVLPDDWIAGILVRPCCRALQGSFKIWNSATVGGNLCIALPAGPIAALATALDGSCIVWRPDGSERVVAAADFVTDAQQNCLEPGEILRRIDIPAAAFRRRSAFRRASLSPQGRSGALLLGTLGDEGHFGVTVTAATRRPVRLDFAAVPTRDHLGNALTDAIPEALIFDDVHGAPDWRRHMTLLLAEEIRVELSDLRP